jgi:hypothetical protein
MPAGRLQRLWLGWARRGCVTPIYGFPTKLVTHPRLRVRGTEAAQAW